LVQAEDSKCSGRVRSFWLAGESVMIAVNQAVELIASVRAAGGTIHRDGDTIELAAPVPLTNDLVDRIRAAKPLLLAALDDFPEWEARHKDALAHWCRLGFPEKAAQLAWGSLQNRWHREYGKRFPVWQCAGCGELIGGVPALTMIDGNRVHLDDIDCLIRYGQHWRGEATEALLAIGLQPPAGEGAE
jgi:hypothetical protein